MPCVGRGRASLGTSLGSLSRRVPPDLLPSLILGMCQHCTGQLSAFPAVSGDNRGAASWNLPLLGWIWAEESGRAGLCCQGWEGGRALVAVLLRDQNSTHLPG